jgi:hypothetical protein
VAPATTLTAFAPVCVYRTAFELVGAPLNQLNVPVAVLIDAFRAFKLTLVPLQTAGWLGRALTVGRAVPVRVTAVLAVQAELAVASNLT